MKYWRRGWNRDHCTKHTGRYSWRSNKKIGWYSKIFLPPDPKKINMKNNKTNFFVHSKLKLRYRSTVFIYIHFFPAVCNSKVTYNHPPATRFFLTNWTTPDATAWELHSRFTTLQFFTLPNLRVGHNHQPSGGSHQPPFMLFTPNNIMHVGHATSHVFNVLP